MIYSGAKDGYNCFEVGTLYTMHLNDRRRFHRRSLRRDRVSRCFEQRDATVCKRISNFVLPCFIPPPPPAHLFIALPPLQVPPSVLMRDPTLIKKIMKSYNLKYVAAIENPRPKPKVRCRRSVCHDR